MSNLPIDRLLWLLVRSDMTPEEREKALEEQDEAEKSLQEKRAQLTKL